MVETPITNNQRLTTINQLPDPGYSPVERVAGRRGWKWWGFGREGLMQKGKGKGRG